MVVFHWRWPRSDFAADATLIPVAWRAGADDRRRQDVRWRGAAVGGRGCPAAGEQLSIVGRTCFGIAQVLGPNGAMITGQGFSEPTSDSYVGVWDLMDRGWMLGPRLNTSGLTDWSSPAHLNPYEKARLGWLQPISSPTTCATPRSPRSLRPAPSTASGKKVGAARSSSWWRTGSGLASTATCRRPACWCGR